MIIILKTMVLFAAIFLVMPIAFFVLVGMAGGLFALEVDPNSWLAKTKIKWIRSFVSKFLS